MPLEIRAPTLDEWPDVCAVDARGFGVSYTAEDIEDVGAALQAGSARRFGSLQIATTAKRHDMAEHVLLVLVQEPVAPIDGVAQRPVALGGRSRASNEHREAIIDAVGQLRQAHAA